MEILRIMKYALLYFGYSLLIAITFVLTISYAQNTLNSVEPERLIMVLAFTATLFIASIATPEK